MFFVLVLCLSLINKTYSCVQLFDYPLLTPDCEFSSTSTYGPLICDTAGFFNSVYECSANGLIINSDNQVDISGALCALHSSVLCEDYATLEFPYAIEFDLFHEIGDSVYFIVLVGNVAFVSGLFGPSICLLDLIDQTLSTAPIDLNSYIGAIGLKFYFVEENVTHLYIDDVFQHTYVDGFDINSCSSQAEIELSIAISTLVPISDLKLSSSCSPESCPPYIFECTKDCGGLNGVCVVDESGEEYCVCFDEWIGEYCNETYSPVLELCDENCLHGHYDEEGGVCVCDYGYEGSVCQLPSDPISLPPCTAGKVPPIPQFSCFGVFCNSVDVCNGHGLCQRPDSCFCDAFWSGETCNTSIICGSVHPYVFNCTKDCGINGLCTEDEFGNEYCSCDAGWHGEFCDVVDYTFDCTKPCVEGICTEDVNGDDYCTCAIGWEGEFCDVLDYDYVCDLACLNGICVVDSYYAPSCSCDLGWNGTLCNLPVCDPSCENGLCQAPGTCICDPEWIGPTCETPVCDPGCVNGECTSPGTCTCTLGWSGVDCGTPICDPPCDNGQCVAPDSCVCAPDWIGDLCNESCPPPFEFECTKECGLNGICTLDEVEGEHCVCAEGWGGGNCTVNMSTCVDIEPCKWPYQGIYPHCIKITCNGIEADKPGVCGKIARHFGKSRGNCVAQDTCECCCGWTENFCTKPSYWLYKKCKWTKEEIGNCKFGYNEGSNDDDDDNDDEDRRNLNSISNMQLLFEEQVQALEQMDHIYETIENLIEDDQPTNYYKKMSVITEIYDLYKEVNRVFEQQGLEK